MRKILKCMVTLLLIAAAFYLGEVNAERQYLQNNLIRLHVVADSDSQEDQAIKLCVRDAITERLQGVMNDFADAESAKAYLQEQLTDLERVANKVLESAQSTCRAVVTLSDEAFPARQYDTFSLPAGVYQSLRITIGSGEGQNWWCVVFPQLCVSTTSEDFEDTAVSAGFSDTLTGSVTGKQEYRVRFFFMDCLGWIDNLFHWG